MTVRPTGGDCCWLEEFAFSPCVTLPPQKHCDRQKANLRIRFKPSLFQHVGTHSSLAGKIQKLKVGGAALGRVEHSRASAELRQGGGGQSRPPSTCVPPPPGQGLWEACAADGAREPTGRGEHEPQDVPALHPGEGLPARGFLLGLHTLCRGLHPLPLLPAAATGAVSAIAHRPTLGEGEGGYRDSSLTTTF